MVVYPNERKAQKGSEERKTVAFADTKDLTDWIKRSGGTTLGIPERQLVQDVCKIDGNLVRRINIQWNKFIEYDCGHIAKDLLHPEELLKNEVDWQPAGAAEKRHSVTLHSILMQRASYSLCSMQFSMIDLETNSASSATSRNSRLTTSLQKLLSVCAVHLYAYLTHPQLETAQ